MRPSRDLLLKLVTLVAMLCLASTANAQVLFWLDTNYGAPKLNKSDANGNAIASVALTAGALPEGLAVDATGKIYWAEAAWSGAKINRAAATLSSISAIVTGGSAFRGVAVDQTAGLLYWTTSNLLTGASIRRSALDGTGAVTLVALPGGSNPRGIAVDHPGGKIWWADFDLNTIYQANLDGSSVTPWVGLASGSGPYGVAVDPAAGQVYWTEYNTGQLRRSSTVSPGVATPYFGLDHPTYLAIDVAGSRLYWSEGAIGNQHVKRGPIAGGAVTTLPCPLTTYGGLVYQPNATVSAKEPAPPADFALEPMWVSPGRGPFPMRFALPREARARMSVVDLQGREIEVLADGVTAAGFHDAMWTPRPAEKAGIYFVRFAAGGRTWVRRLALIR